MLSKIYLETTNVCNLACSFCHGTCRPPRFMTPEEFAEILFKIQGKAKYLYLHLMGEPLLNPHISEMARMAHSIGFDVMFTTNGTLLDKCGQFLYADGTVKKVSISLQSVDIINGEATAHTQASLENYLESCANFAGKCAENNVICVLRLWNIDSDKAKNDNILEILHRLFPDKWIKNRSGFKLFCAPRGEKEVYLEFGDLFEWPDINGDRKNVTFCHAIRDQIGILCDGTVVPCCLDADGTMKLGNIFSSDFDSIINSPRAQKILSSFENRSPCEDICLTCGYAKRF